MNLDFTVAEVLEWTSVVLNILFTILLGREIRFGWVLGFIASVIGVWIYVEQVAWLISALNGFYAIMGIYGWWHWGRIDVEETGIVSIDRSKHVVIIGVGIAITLLLVFAMRTMELEGKYLWMEAFIAAFAIVATWLMSKKILENWIYWTVGDAVGLVYNYLMDLNGYAILMIVYIILAVVGYINWKKEMCLALDQREQKMP